MNVARGKSKRVAPVSAGTRAKITAAVEALFVEGHTFHAMQFYFVQAIMARVQQCELSKTKQARDVLVIHKNKYYELIHWTTEGNEVAP